MSTRNTIFVTIILIAFAVVFSLSVYNRLPDQMASHWNTANQVDGYISRFWGAFLMPIISAAMLLLFLVIPRIDPLKANIAQFREYFNAFITLVVAFMIYMHVLTVLWNLGYNQFNMGSAMLPAMGLLFIFAGVLMRKAKRNFFIGIRTPWTLSSDRVWDETHRLGSILTRSLLSVHGFNGISASLFICAVSTRNEVVGVFHVEQKTASVFAAVKNNVEFSVKK